MCTLNPQPPILILMATFSTTFPMSMKVFSPVRLWELCNPCEFCGSRQLKSGLMESSLSTAASATFSIMGSGVKTNFLCFLLMVSVPMTSLGTFMPKASGLMEANMTAYCVDEEEQKRRRQERETCWVMQYFKLSMILTAETRKEQGGAEAEEAGGGNVLSDPIT